MATPTIGFNPMLTTNASGFFQTTSSGFVQGEQMADPAIRYALRQGVVSASATKLLYGGVAITETIPTSVTPGSSTGPIIDYAATAAAINGFTVFTQGYNGIVNTSNPVPTYGSGMSIMTLALGSNARIAVNVESGLAATLSAGSSAINTQVSWDFTKQQLVKYSAAYNNVTITGAVWASTSGGQTTYTVGTDLSAVLVAGDQIEVTGVVSTGATTDGYNGTYIVVSVSSTTIVVTAVRAASPGTYSSGGTVLAGGGALACKILRVNIGGSLTTQTDTSGNLVWNPTGNTAIIQI